MRPPSEKALKRPSPLFPCNDRPPNRSFGRFHESPIEPNRLPMFSQLIPVPSSVMTIFTNSPGSSMPSRWTVSYITSTFLDKASKLFQINSERALMGEAVPTLSKKSCLGEIAIAFMEYSFQHAEFYVMAKLRICLARPGGVDIANGFLDMGDFRFRESDELIELRIEILAEIQQTLR